MRFNSTKTSETVLARYGGAQKKIWIVHKVLFDWMRLRNAISISILFLTSSFSLFGAIRKRTENEAFIVHLRRCSAIIKEIKGKLNRTKRERKSIEPIPSRVTYCIAMRKETENVLWQREVLNKFIEFFLIFLLISFAFQFSHVMLSLLLLFIRHYTVQMKKKLCDNYSTSNVNRTASKMISIYVQIFCYLFDAKCRNLQICFCRSFQNPHRSRNDNQI